MSDMDDMMEKIQEVLSDDESVKQLKELAASLFSSSENNENEIENENENKSESNEAKEDKSDSDTDFDFNKLLMLGQIMSTASAASDDKNSQLLLSLKPLLKEERQAKVDKAVKLLKLIAVWNVLKDSGMLENLI